MCRAKNKKKIKNYMTILIHNKGDMLIRCSDNKKLMWDLPMTHLT